MAAFQGFQPFVNILQDNALTVPIANEGRYITRQEFFRLCEEGTITNEVKQVYVASQHGSAIKVKMSAAGLWYKFLGAIFLFRKNIENLDADIEGTRASLEAALIQCEMDKEDAKVEGFTDVEDWVLENDVKNKAAALAWVATHRANISHLEAKRSAMNAKFSTDLEAMIKAVRGESQSVFI